MVRIRACPKPRSARLSHVQTLTQVEEVILRGCSRVLHDKLLEFATRLDSMQAEQCDGARGVGRGHSESKAPMPTPLPTVSTDGIVSPRSVGDGARAVGRDGRECGREASGEEAGRTKGLADGRACSPSDLSGIFVSGPLVFLPCSVPCNAGVIAGMLGRQDCAQAARKVYTEGADEKWQRPLQ